MGKILVNLTVPAIHESFDILLPDFIRVRQLTPVVAEAVAEVSYGRYVISGRERLCGGAPEKELEPDFTAAECGVTNGSKLLLF